MDMVGQEQNFKSECHMSTFLSWDLDPRIKGLIEATCFKHFLRIPKGVLKLNMKVITALAKFYDVNHNAFAFGETGNEFYVDIGLQDILYTTGLPIDGLQVSGFEDADPCLTIQDNLNLTKDEAMSLFYNKKTQNSLTISLKKLKQRFEKVPDDVTDLMPYQKAYLFFLVGNLLVATSTEGISSMYLPLLGESVNDYAWRAATLSFIKHGLKLMKQDLMVNDTTRCHGFRYALMIFALERFPCLCHALGIKEVPSGFPLLSQWLILFPKGNDKKCTKNHLRDKLQNLSENEVTWEPYKSSTRNLELPHEYKDHICMIYSCSPCICFNVIAYNRPHQFFKQLGLEEDHDENDDTHSESHEQHSQMDMSLGTSRNQGQKDEAQTTTSSLPNDQSDSVSHEIHQRTMNFSSHSISYNNVFDTAPPTDNETEEVQSDQEDEEDEEDKEEEEEVMNSKSMNDVSKVNDKNERNKK
ncbi:Aminotransferase-like plant mobile domain [Arabidopsis thaliana x Arabidopsis arenosa]|uniref:Aminotransferase-like plant mobile domain n=1 Tax=Arabidopsis thaliana x Arabidopsis arenosa TaxID=1240361 RepID=A0A8T1ZKV9_9BRAS|nr:Aminotransferase-like plant mobile domain [Arabidopsis thaliana x Arabidopsis arenosa]